MTCRSINKSNAPLTMTGMVSTVPLTAEEEAIQNIGKHILANREKAQLQRDVARLKFYALQGAPSLRNVALDVLITCTMQDCVFLKKYVMGEMKKIVQKSEGCATYILNGSLQSVELLKMLAKKGANSDIRNKAVQALKGCKGGLQMLQELTEDSCVFIPALGALSELSCLDVTHTLPCSIQDGDVTTPPQCVQMQALNIIQEFAEQPLLDCLEKLVVIAKLQRIGIHAFYDDISIEVLGTLQILADREPPSSHVQRKALKAMKEIEEKRPLSIIGYLARKILTKFGL